MNKKIITRPNIDIIAVIIITVTSSILSAIFDIYDFFYHFSRDLENYEVDEIIPSLFAFTLCMTWFALRRWKEKNIEVKRRIQVEKKLRKHEYELEELVDERTEDLRETNKELQAAL